jgi:transcriptional regulator with XRE-family HTH domain
VEEIARDAVCARIRQKRIESGLSQKAAARLFGVVPRSYQEWEKAVVPYARIPEIAKAFSVDAAWLLYGDDQPQDLAREVAELRDQIAGLRDEIRSLARRDER